jgi:hypothetical protein
LLAEYKYFVSLLRIAVQNGSGGVGDDPRLSGKEALRLGAMQTGQSTMGYSSQFLGVFVQPLIAFEKPQQTFQNCRMEGRSGSQ